MISMQRAWQRLACLYLKKELELTEIVKASIIFSAGGFLGDVRNVKDIGVNVFDHSDLNSALIYGILYSLQEADEELVSYTKISKIISLHPQTIGKAVNRLIKENTISREDFGSSGSRYVIIEKPNYAIWIFQFTNALVALWLDEKLREEIEKEVEHVEFQRGMDVLKRELREKFYRPSKKKK